MLEDIVTPTMKDSVHEVLFMDLMLFNYDFVKTASGVKLIWIKSLGDTEVPHSSHQTSNIPSYWVFVVNCHSA